MQPSVRLTAGGASVEVDVDRGGRLSSLRVGDRELLVGTPDRTDRSIYWGAFLMAPWAGRIADAELTWAGVTHRLPRTDGRHAIHGLTYCRPWTVERASGGELTLACQLADAGWPLGGLVRQELRLTAEALHASAEIVADRPMPAALGWHPWFLRRPDDVRLTVAADETLVTRGLIPTGGRAAVGAVADLRSGPLVGDRRLDHVYVTPRSPAIVRWPDLELRVEYAPPVQTLVVHSRPGALCVEPQTAWPNAPALAARGHHDTGLASLAAGERLRASMTLRWRRIEPH